jgi:hypothetical protein
MSTGVVVLMTNHGSGEGSRVPLEKAVELLTGAPPLSVDARHFMADGGGRVGLDRNGFEMEVASEGFVMSPEVLIVYEIPPADHGRLVALQRNCHPKDRCLSARTRMPGAMPPTNGAPLTASAGTAFPTWRRSRCASRIWIRRWMLSNGSARTSGRGRR